MKKHDYFGSPEKNRPQMIIRLRSGHELPGVWERLLEQLKQNREICDEVWFATGIGFPTLEEHRRKSERLAECAEDLRAAGITASLQIQATIGHGDRTFADNSIAGKNWGSYVGRNGEVTRTCNCPYQEGFQNYMAELSRIYAQWHPASVWIDDDLRLTGHHPASEPFGCYCDDCLALFSKLENNSFSRSGLLSACENDPELEQRWRNFAISSVTRLAEIIVKNFLAVAPGTRFGFQHGAQPEREAIIRAMAVQANAKAGSRPGGGASSDHVPYELIDKAFLISRQTYTQCGYEIISQLCPEIETYPRNFGCKTARGLTFETMLYIAMGADSMSYFIMDPVCETPEWYGKALLAPLAAAAPAFRKLIQINENTIASGVGRAEKRFCPILEDNSGLSLIGAPQAGFSPAANCIALNKFTVDTLNDAELEAVLKKNIILDGPAAQAVSERGFGALLGNIAVAPLNNCIFDYCTDDPLNSGIENAKHFPFSEERFVFTPPAETPVRVLTTYQDGEKKFCGIATLLLERQDKIRVALIGYAGFYTKYISSSRAILLNRIADWVSGETLSALPLEAVQTMIVPRVTADNTLRSVTVLNTTIGESFPFRLLLRGVPENARIYWHTPGCPPLELTCERSTVTIPALSAWSIGFVAVEK